MPILYGLAELKGVLSEPVVNIPKLSCCAHLTNYWGNFNNPSIELRIYCAPSALLWVVNWLEREGYEHTRTGNKLPTIRNPIHIVRLARATGISSRALEHWAAETIRGRYGRYRWTYAIQALEAAGTQLPPTWQLMKQELAVWDREPMKHVFRRVFGPAARKRRKLAKQTPK